MAAPSVSFTTIASSLTDADSPLRASTVTNLYNNTVHLEEWLGNSYTAAQNHDHDGTNSASVALPGPWNMVTDPFPQSSGGAPLNRWNLSGATYNALTGIRFTTSGNYGWHNLFEYADADSSRAVLGTGADLVLSFLLRQSAALSAGVIKVGFADNSTSAWLANASFSVSYSSVSSTWKRFWTRVSGITVVTDCRVLARVTTSFTGGSVDFAAITVTPGTTLPPMVWPPDVKFNSYSYSNAGEVPILDSSVMVDNVTYVAAS